MTSERVPNIRRKIAALLDALDNADRDLFIEATDLLLTCWEHVREEGESLAEAEACVDMALATLQDRSVALAHVRQALSHLRRAS